MRIFSISVFFVFFLMLSFFSWAQDKKVPGITVQQLITKIGNDTNLVILDVRNPQELDGPLGKIDGAINIPVVSLELRVHELDYYKDREIAVICRSGRRSKRATEILLQNGFNAENVLGGMKEYRALKNEN